MQSLAPEPAAQRHAETDTGPHGLSSIQQDAVQAIIAHCLEAKDQLERRYGEMELRVGRAPTSVVMAQSEYIGFAAQTFRMILEECRRLT